MTAKSDLAQAVVIERTYNAPVEKVWKALTDVDQMRQWYFDLKAKSPKSFRKRKSPTPGDMRARKAIH